MSSWGDWYEAIWDALVNLIKGIAEFGDSAVFYGEKNIVERFPSAFVCPMSAEGAPITFRETLWQPEWEILVVNENPDTKTGMVDVCKLAGMIIDALIADRTLGGLLHNLEPYRVTPYPRDLGRGTEQHWVSVSVRCQRKR